MPDDDLRYPTGKFSPKTGPLGADERAILTDRIAEVPALLEEALGGLSDEQLDTPYRDGGWSPRQLTHHIADSHLNSFIRFKLAVTEENPKICTYEQAPWAETPDVRDVPVSASLAIVRGLHERWVHLLRSLRPDDFGRTVQHPEHGRIDLDFLLQLYAWHGHHHVAHIQGLRARQGW